MKRLALLLLVAACSKRARTEEELARERYTRNLVEHEGALRSFKLASSYDVRFGAGFGHIEYEPKGDFHNRAFRWIGQHSIVHLRSHGNKPMRLSVYGWVNTPVIYTRPSVAAYIDGRAIAEMLVDEEGAFGLVGTAPADILAGKEWVTLEIDVSSVGWHWFDPPKLKVPLIVDFDWSESP